MVNFPNRIPFSSDASICSIMAFPPLVNSDHVVVSVSIDLPSNSQRDASFHCIAYDYSRDDCDNLLDRLRDVPWEDIFKLSASAAASAFWEQFRAGIEVFIPYRKYQVKPHLSPWFSATYAAAIVNRNHFFRLHQQNKCSAFKAKFRQASNSCKRVLEAAKLASAKKQKSASLTRNFALETFGELPTVFSTKVNPLYFLSSTVQKRCLLHLIKQHCLLNTFLRTLILINQISLYLFSLLELM